MGYWKDVAERGLGGHEYEYVCGACLQDPGLRGVVEDEACATACTFCDAESADPIAAPMAKVLLYIDECLDREYDVAENCLSYDKEMGRYLGTTWTTMEVLETHLGDVVPNETGTLMDALCDGLGDRLWCRLDPYGLTQSEELTFSWDAFCELIKYERRYFFFRQPAGQELFSPLALFEELGNWCERFGLVRTLCANHLLYRARLQKNGEKLETAAALGPPPRDMATMANRMSPPGIVMFYAGDEVETALREVAKNPAEDMGRYAIGKFRTLREAKILDLTSIPPVPSIFEPVPDSLEYNPRPPLIFLNYFVAALSKPIARDDSVYVEYIPSQVVTEYFRTGFVHEGAPLAGIRYRSARHPGGRSLVMFASQDNLVGVDDPEGSPFLMRDRWIEFVDRDEREVTVDDLKRWDGEAQRPFDWI